jgi:hypothetical protein
MPKCDCCDREVEKVFEYYWTRGDLVCTDCAIVWYDAGLRHKEEIKRIVLGG